MTARKAKQAPKAKADDRAAKISKALDLIASGESVRKACDLAGIHEATFRANVDHTQYARARESQADTHFDEMADMERECRDGDLPPETFRALMDSRKWRLARMRPKVYGEKSQVDHTSSDGSMSPPLALHIDFVDKGADGGPDDAV
jgi:hypothetical protein